ncbi:WG repeat-containing protein [Micromonospora lupini]|uniref:WG repeat-containing protein n=1 Tax=Micromonospora lupini TaxID=285679 RepID=UPI00225047FB|nr:WG repeat-containing protein [Micromonospora lupini]MCX5066477.1 WG repeat-containing protein [Micromonospora lupini]
MNGRYTDRWRDPNEPSWVVEPTTEWHPQFPGQRYPGDIGVTHQPAPPPRGRASVVGRTEVPPLAPTRPDGTYLGRSWADESPAEPAPNGRWGADDEPGETPSYGWSRGDERPADTTHHGRPETPHYDHEPYRRPLPEPPRREERRSPESDRRTAWSDRRPGDDRGPAREAAWHREQPTSERHDGRPPRHEPADRDRAYPTAPPVSPGPYSPAPRSDSGWVPEPDEAPRRRGTSERPAASHDRHPGDGYGTRPARGHDGRPTDGWAAEGAGQWAPVDSRSRYRADGHPDRVPDDARRSERLPDDARRAERLPDDMRRAERLPDDARRMERGVADGRSRVEAGPGAPTDRQRRPDEAFGPPPTSEGGRRRRPEPEAPEQPRRDDERRRPDVEPHRHQPREAAARTEAYPDRRPHENTRPERYGEEQYREDSYREPRSQPGPRSGGSLPWPTPGPVHPDRTREPGYRPEPHRGAEPEVPSRPAARPERPPAEPPRYDERPARPAATAPPTSRRATPVPPTPVSPAAPGTGRAASAPPTPVSPAAPGTGRAASVPQVSPERQVSPVPVSPAGPSGDRPVSAAPISPAPAEQLWQPSPSSARPERDRPVSAAPVSPADVPVSGPPAARLRLEFLPAPVDPPSSDERPESPQRPEHRAPTERASTADSRSTAPPRYPGPDTGNRSPDRRRDDEPAADQRQPAPPVRPVPADQPTHTTPSQRPSPTVHDRPPVAPPPAWQRPEQPATPVTPQSSGPAPDAEPALPIAPGVPRRYVPPAPSEATVPSAPEPAETPARGPEAWFSNAGQPVESDQDETPADQRPTEGTATPTVAGTTDTWESGSGSADSPPHDEDEHGRSAASTQPLSGDPATDRRPDSAVEAATPIPGPLADPDSPPPIRPVSAPPADPTAARPAPPDSARPVSAPPVSAPPVSAPPDSASPPSASPDPAWPVSAPPDSATPLEVADGERYPVVDDLGTHVQPASEPTPIDGPEPVSGSPTHPVSGAPRAWSDDLLDDTADDTAATVEPAPAEIHRPTGDEPYAETPGHHGERAPDDVHEAAGPTSAPTTDASTDASSPEGHADAEPSDRPTSAPPASSSAYPSTAGPDTDADPAGSGPATEATRTPPEPATERPTATAPVSAPPAPTPPAAQAPVSAPPAAQAPVSAPPAAQVSAVPFDGIPAPRSGLSDQDAPVSAPPVTAPETPRPSLADQGDPEQVLAAYRWRLDPVTLREELTEPDAMRAIRRRLTEKLGSAVDNRARARLLSLRAVASRILGDLDDALADGRLALTYAEATGELRRTALAQARLAHVLRWRGDYAEADQLFAEANSIELPDRLRAALHEHAGRCCYDQGRLMEACHHFERALDLRGAADAELLDRVRVALDAVTARASADGFGPYARGREEVLDRDRPPQPDRDGPLWGYTDHAGDLVIPARYAEAQPFHDGLAWVRRPDTDRWSLINLLGTTVIPPSFRAVRPFSDGLAWVVTDGGWTAIDPTGAVQVPPNFADVRPFRRGLAAVKREGWGAVDRTGRIVVPTRYHGFVTELTEGGPVDGFTDEGLVVVDVAGRRGVVDRTGAVLVQPSYPMVVIHPVAFLVGSGGGRWGALDRRGAPLIDPVHPDRAAVLEEIDRLLTDANPVL